MLPMLTELLLTSAEYWLLKSLHRFQEEICRLDTDLPILNRER